MAQAPTRPPRRMTPERRREHLIEAALELYGSVPPEQVTIDDVTRNADVSRALFYRYFPNIGALHVAALQSVVDELVARVVVAPGGSPPEQLRQALDTFLAIVEQHAKAFVALLRSGSVIATGETEALVDGVRKHIVTMLATGLGVAEPRPLLLMTLRGWVALVEGTFVAWLQDPAIPRAELLDWLAEQLAGMLAVTAARQ
jgi:AcrR family transcriptional regulator